jgi:hypothetical protein
MVEVARSTSNTTQLVWLKFVFDKDAHSKGDKRTLSSIQFILVLDVFVRCEKCTVEQDLQMDQNNYLQNFATGERMV